jgi:hypothetical protein
MFRLPDRLSRKFLIDRSSRRFQMSLMPLKLLRLPLTRRFRLNPQFRLWRLHPPSELRRWSRMFHLFR